MSTFPQYNQTHWFRIVPYDAETSLALNVQGTSGPGNNVNVNLYSQTNDLEQFWRVEIRSDGAFIINRRNEAFALDWYSPNNNCDVYTLAGNETDANIDLLTRSDSYGYYYLIKNESSDKYLTVDNATAASGANVVWATYKGTGLDGRQRWRFVQGDAYTGSGNGDHLIVNNSVYEFISLKSLTDPSDATTPTKALNMWGSSAGNNVNVNLYTIDHSDTQRWQAVRYSETDDTWFLASMANTNYVLDRYRGSAALNNADIYPKATTAADRADQLVTFTLCGTYGSYQVYYINMASDGMKLSAVDTNNGSGTGKMSTSTGNVYFGSGTGDLQKWVAVPSNGSDTVSGEITVTNMPSGAGYDRTNGNEYFHPDSGMFNGTWAVNNGSAIEGKIRDFFKTVYKTTSNPTNNQYLHSLFGGKFVEGIYIGQYHPGVDVFKEHGAKLYSAHSGDIIAITDFYVKIKPDNCNKYVFYVHLQPDATLKAAFEASQKTRISVGDLLGTQSNNGLAGATGTKDSHLHFEVQSAVDSTPRLPAPTVSDSLVALPPYDYM